MKLISTENLVASLKPGSISYKLCKWFVDNANFCSDYFDGTEKPENKVYSFFLKYWLFPFEQTGCPCCNAVRGLIYGALIGYIIGAYVC